MGMYKFCSICGGESNVSPCEGCVAFLNSIIEVDIVMGVYYARYISAGAEFYAHITGEMLQEYVKRGGKIL